MPDVLEVSDLPPVYGSSVSFKNSVMDGHVGSTEGDLECDVEDRPLSAEQYCSAYYPIPEETGTEKKGVKEDVLKNIDALRNDTGRAGRVLTTGIRVQCTGGLHIKY
ncbi:hypothetical protein K438DRAFT_1766280 [Mycena galopus ATCC 62051]|nr:hypothetical protein K438DRAFT_1766280 [Mycena galopus ATCC 62051]